MLRHHSKCTYTISYKVDLDENGRIKGGGKLKSHAISQTAYTRSQANLWLMGDSEQCEGVKHARISK